MSTTPLLRDVTTPVGRRRALRSRRPGSARLDPVCVLDVLDVPDPIEDVAATRRGCLAARATVLAGPWNPPSDPDRAEGWLGLLIVDGLLTRTVGAGRLRSKELLGPGDLLRPWDVTDPDANGVPEWEALEDTRVALLDRRFAARTVEWPAIGEALLRTTVRRSHSAAMLLSTCRARRADDRLLLLFGHLADRWGRVGIDGIRIPVRLTHQVIGSLVCLRRPTVSSTLARLRDEGRLVRLEDGAWLLPRADPRADQVAA